MNKQLALSHIAALLGGAALGVGVNLTALQDALNPDIRVSGMSLYRFNEQTGDAGESSYQWAVEVRAAGYATPDAEEPFTQGAIVRQFDGAVPSELAATVASIRDDVLNRRLDAGKATTAAPTSLKLFSAASEDAGFGYEWCDEAACVSGAVGMSDVITAGASYWALGKAKDANQ